MNCTSIAFAPRYKYQHRETRKQCLGILMERVLILQPPQKEDGVPPFMQTTLLELLVVVACAGGDVACPAEGQKERQDGEQTGAMAGEVCEWRRERR